MLREKRVSPCASVLCAIAIGFALTAYQSNSSRELAQASLEAPTGSAKPDQMSIPSNSQFREKTPIVIAEARDVRRRLEFPGVVQAIPTRTVAVLSPVVGRVSGVQIQLGDRVSEKQEIATIIVDDNVAGQPSLRVQNQNGPRRISLRSPIAGSIIDVQTEPGNTVRRGSNVAAVADLTAIWVSLDLSRRDVSRVAEKTAEIVFAAYPGSVFGGELELGDAFRGNAERGIGRIELNNPDINLKLNMAAVVTLFGPRQLAIVVPKSALVQKNDVANVFIEVAACTFELRPVEVAFLQGKDAIVARGLESGDRVLAFSVVPPIDRRLRTAC